MYCMLSGNKTPLLNDNLLVIYLGERLIVASYIELLTPALLLCSISARDAANYVLYLTENCFSVETELSGFVFFSVAVWFIQSFKIIVAFLVQVLKIIFEVLCNITLMPTLLTEMLLD